MRKKDIAVVYSTDHIIHSTTDKNFMEVPERLTRIVSYLKRVNVFDENCVLHTDFKEASTDDVLMVHDVDYVRFIKSYCDKGGGFLGDSTYFTRGTYKAAMKAAGGAIEASSLTLEEKCASSFALVRPPGHHATKNKFGGYCIFNNAAIAARYLILRKKLKRVMILDWDSHAANGTMNIFYDDPKVVVVSIHQEPSDFYPRDGFTHQVGRGQGRGTSVNVEMPAFSGDEEYGRVMEDIVKPIYSSFKPQFVIGCCGFDTHWSDNTSKLKLSANGYYDIVSSLRKFDSPLAIVLEGGYSNSNGKLTYIVLKALQGEDVKIKDEVTKPDVEKKLDKNLAQLKRTLSEFYKF
jgi:acetoin utilization deacetylase AcuC-like enzyme